MSIVNKFFMLVKYILTLLFFIVSFVTSGREVVSIVDLTSFKQEKEQPHSPLLESKADSYLTKIDLIPYMNFKELKGQYIYTVRIRDTSAYALSLYFSKFDIPDFATFSIQAGSEKREYKSTESKTLAVLPFIGSELTIFVTGSMPLEPIIEIGGFGSIPEGEQSLQFSSRFKASGACNIDLNCPEGEGWGLVGKAVCKLQVGNSRLNCTGTLVNNTAQNARPMILTANHCIPDSLSAVNTVFIFNYILDDCDGEREEYYTLSGSKLLATSKDKSLDFALVELWDPLPEKADVYFAGWDLGTNQFSTGTVIHHPRGDVKKISSSMEVPQVDWFTDPQVPYDLTANSHWLVSEWEYGVTEGGSSGAALLNSELKIIGTLTGGDAKCGNPYDDYFQMISYSWNYFSDSTQQLKYWLDPLDSGILSFDGFDPRISVDLEDMFNETYSNDSMHVYPNPVYSGEVVIKLGEKLSQAKACKLYDLQGQLWLDCMNDLYPDGTIMKLDVGGFPSGIYNLYVETYQVLVNRKIVIKN